MQPLVNRVVNSKLLTLKLDELVPPVETVEFDLADHLWKGLALREKDFRAAIKAYDWSSLSAKRLCMFCSADAIIPQWAYMLVGSAAAPFAQDVIVGTPTEADQVAFALAALNVEVSQYEDKMVVLKGCTDGRTVGPQAYATLARRLTPVVKSLMYGEPCSTVPIYKQKK
ncbi:MAG: DUF2480 family protein [Saprospiraceae bacterium]